MNGSRSVRKWQDLKLFIVIQGLDLFSEVNGKYPSVTKAAETREVTVMLTVVTFLPFQFWLFLFLKLSIWSEMFTSSLSSLLAFISRWALSSSEPSSLSEE